jgi:hypothetical protein
MDDVIKDRIVTFIFAVAFLLLLGFLENAGWLKAIVDFALKLVLHIVAFLI